jgi:REP element-mobilizing transposase RayT
MAKTEHYYTQFEEENFYHVYNRTVDKKPMFKNRGNYEYFLRQYDKYLSPVAATYSYCLLSNHFHLLIRISDLKNLKNFESSNSKNTESNKTVHQIVSHQFRKFFQSYSMAFNLKYNRIGTLFQTPFKRVEVDKDEYFTQLVYYIHANPQLHGLIKDFREWEWSSYSRILINKPSKLKKKEVLDWFGGEERYIQFHREHHENILNTLAFNFD